MYDINERIKQGEISKKCDEGYIDLQLDNNGNIGSFKGYCKAKDFKKVMGRLK